jgi:L-lysine 6-oxidase
LYGQENSYQNQKIPFRNPDVPQNDRQTLIVDPGPRTISGKQSSIGFDQDNVPAGYPAQYPPQEVLYGVPVVTLGDLLTDNSGRLVVLGGFGHAGGNLPLTSYGGSSTWHDDISDGPVYCTVNFNDGTPSVSLTAWVVIGSPDFAPEIVNISNLSDTMFDVGVRNFNLVPEMYSNGNYNPTFRQIFREIFYRLSTESANINGLRMYSR